MYLHFRRISTLFGPPFFWSLLAFSTFQHRLASFNLPKIPIFRIWLDRFQLFLVGKSRSFPVFTLARYQRWAAPRCVFFPSANTHHSLPHLHRHGVTSTASHIHHSNSHHLDQFFASTQPGAVSTFAHHTTLLKTFFAGIYLTLFNGRQDNIFLLRSLIWPRTFLISFVCSNFQNFFASPRWEKELWGWLYL